MRYYVNIYKCGTEKFYTNPNDAAPYATSHECDGEVLDYERTEVRNSGVISDNDFFGGE